MLRKFAAAVALAACALLVPAHTIAQSCEDYFWACHAGAMGIYNDYESLTMADMFLKGCMDHYGC